MKFIINREQLLLPLQKIVNVIEKRQTMPILSNVFLKIENNELILTGTDLEIQIIAIIPSENNSPGVITVPARKFLDICRLLPQQAEISFSLVDDKVKIHSGKSRFTLSTLPAADYPKFSESTMECSFKINAEQLNKALEKTVFCMANQDVRYYLNGLMVNVSNKKLKMVSSDGHRLSVYQDEIDQATGIEASIIIPRKGILELSRLLDDPETEVTVQFSNNNIKVDINRLYFSAKLIDAKYPDFDKVFRQEFFNQIQILKQPFKEALTRVAILANEQFKGISLAFEPDKLTISTHNPEHEEAEEELSIDYSGDPITIAFNAQYILDAVSNLDSELAVLTIAGNLSCCFIEEPNEQKFKFIIMPMRL